MKLNVTARIDFDVEQRMPFTEDRRVMDVHRWLTQILKHVDSSEFADYYSKFQKSLQPAVLSLEPNTFRQRYSKWIYSHYSDSLANHQMVWQNERSVLFRWVRQFNQIHQYLKIVQILPEINQTHDEAYLLFGGYDLHHQVLSFDVNRALREECQPSASLHYFEVNENRRIVHIMQQLFDRCIPDAPFRFCVGKRHPRSLKRSRPTSSGSVKPSHSAGSSSSSLSSNYVSSTASQKLSSVSSRSRLSSASAASQVHSLVSVKNNSSSISGLKSRLSSAVNHTSQLTSQLSAQRDIKMKMSSRLDSMSAQDSVGNNLNQSLRASYQSHVSSLSSSVFAVTHSLSESAERMVASMSASAQDRVDSYRSENSKREMQHSQSGSSFFRSQEYIPFIIIVSIFIILLLILVFPLLKL